MNFQFCAVKFLCKHHYAAGKEKGFLFSLTELAPTSIHCAPRVLVDGCEVTQKQERQRQTSFFLIVYLSPFKSSCLCEECWKRKCSAWPCLSLFYLCSCDNLQRENSIEFQVLQKGKQLGKAATQTCHLVRCGDLFFCKCQRRLNSEFLISSNWQLVGLVGSFLVFFSPCFFQQSMFLCLVIQQHRDSLWSRFCCGVYESGQRQELCPG